MPDEQYRELEAAADAEAAFTRWIAYLRLGISPARQTQIRSEIVRASSPFILGHPARRQLKFHHGDGVALQHASADLDPRNITLSRNFISMWTWKICHPQAAHLVLADVRPLPSRL